MESPGASAGPSEPGPDVMNDPAFDRTEEPDTCRICRGEGSPTEPLFYPCKCSGSIKFVHQDCLMEWLSHSQKKHCELCKTSFRFTKLYHPQMPNAVPLPVFLKQAGVHTMKSLLTWARWNLVILVWLGWVPWCMRTVWRGLFWIGDGGWITTQAIERQTARMNLEILAARGTTPVTRGLPEPALSTASTYSFTRLLPPVWNPIFQIMNVTAAGDSAISHLGRKFFTAFLYPVSRSRISTTPTNATVGFKGSQRSSLLSDLAVLKNLTRSSTVNNLAMDVLEGQLITLLVVVAFILVFLIREWVVQQQPAINAGPLVAEVQHDQDREEQLEQVREALEHPDRLPELRRNDREANEPVDNPLAEGQVAPRAILRPARRNLGRPIEPRDRERSLGEGLQAPGTQRAAQFPGPSGTSSSAAGENYGHSESLARPTLLTSEAFGTASEIQRTLEEEAKSSGQAWPGVDVFMDVWKRADSNPDDVLRIIQEEGREDELRWIVTAMRKLKSTQETSQQYLPEHAHANPGESSSGSSETWSLLEPAPEENPINLSNSEPRGSSQSSSTIRQRQPRGDFDGSEAALMEARQRAERLADLVAAPDPSEGALGVLPTPPDDPESPTFLPEQNTEANVPVPNAEPHDPSVERETEAPPAANLTFGERVQEWLWGQVPVIIVPPDEDDQDDEHVVRNIEDEAPFVPFAQGRLMAGENGDEADEDPEVVQAAIDAGIDENDAEAIEDGEDLEGVMELIGMQGPIAGLIQNGMFSALLISMSLLSGIWIPYVAGKAALVFLANPVVLLIKLPLRWISTAADTVVDVGLVVALLAFCSIDYIVRFCAVPVGWLIPLVRRIISNTRIQAKALELSWGAVERLRQTGATTVTQFSESDIPVFSIIAHESLVGIRELLTGSISRTFGLLQSIVDERPFILKSKIASEYLLNGIIYAISAFIQALGKAVAVASSLKNVNPLRISIDLPQRTRPFDYNLAHWDTRDRVLAIFVGYLFFLLIGTAYLRIKAALRDPEDGEKNEGNLVEILSQAAGVTKVIVIISIEMIAFPLYCGILLDLALLPLFDGATMSSRLAFTLNSPATSIFVHWFVGTCYMFHFALFVSMCRKIMRTGVLYFIRDPDDPSFHPVRDVLERNVYTQLRKIAFSAMVYGALVIICLGTVVWSLSFFSTDIFPIHWSSNEPVLDFPVDLLAYNFVVPIIVEFFKPSKGLNSMYEWWFKKCAHWLRLTHFLFNKRVREEEGYYVQNTRKYEAGRDGQVESSTEAKSDISEAEDKEKKPPRTARFLEPYPDKSEGDLSFVRSGRFVRAPASDQVRLPKGSQTFLEVDENGNRLDGKKDTKLGLHGRDNAMFSIIYIPPHFRLRIASFIVMLWLFAAATGVGMTIIPLLVGRAIFSHRMNDIYAYSIGTYLLGGPLYLLIKYRSLLLQRLHFLRNTSLDRATVRAALYTVFTFSIRAMRLIYFYTSFGLILPSLFAILFETYLLVPFHTYTSRHNAPAPAHTIHFVQDWTLGVLAVKLLARALIAHPESRPAQALRALVNPANRGATWLDPDVRLATRAFILPSLLVMLGALAIPLGAGKLLVLSPVWQVAPGLERAREALMYRYAYPSILGLVLVQLGVRTLVKAVGNWRSKVRDEVYLIGERLHNFGEKKPRQTGRTAVE